MSKQQLNALPAEQRAAMMASKDEYIAFYSRAKDVHLAVSRETGRLLYMLARATNARAMIEFGTSFGISTLHLAAALRDNGGGKLITTDPLHPQMPPGLSNMGWRQFDTVLSRPEPPSVLRARADCGGRLFTAKLGVESVICRIKCSITCWRTTPS